MAFILSISHAFVSKRPFNMSKIDAILCSESQGNNTVAMTMATATMLATAGPSF